MKTGMIYGKNMGTNTDSCTSWNDKNNMEKSQEKQDEETGKQKDEKDKTDIAESKKVS